MHSLRVGVPQGSPSDKWLSAKRRKWIPFKPALTVKAGARAVVGLHHSPKSSAGQEMSLENVLRGTGDLGAMCDAAYGLNRVKQETLKLRVQCVKSRDFEPVAPFHNQGRPYINEKGDFVVLTPAASSADAQCEVESLDKAIRENLTASYRDLAKKTGINLSRIGEVAAKAGWHKNGICGSGRRNRLPLSTDS